MNNKELQNNYDSLQRLHSSANEAIAMLEKRLRELEAENSMLRANIENADKRVMIQKQIVIDNLISTQKEKDKLVEEVMTLRNIIKGLRK